MENEKTFRTKTGFCHILPDKIVLTRDGIVGNISKLTVGNSMAKINITSGCISLIVLYFAFEGYKNGQRVGPILLLLLGLFLINGILGNLNDSTTPIIERNRIKDVTLKRAIVGLRRCRFEVMFEDDNGKLKRRTIMLPGSSTGGQDETEKAIKIMIEEKLLLSPIG